MNAFLALLCAYVMSQFYRTFLAIVAGDLTRDLGFGPAGLGLLSASWFAAFALAQFPIGYALDRFGPRRTIAAFMLAAVAGAGILAASGSLAVSLLGMSLVGIGCGPILMGSMVHFSRHLPADRFALMAGVLIGLGSLGQIAGTVPLALAVQIFGWRVAILATGGLTLIAALLVLALVDEAPPVASSSASLSAAAAVRAIIGTRALWSIFPLALVSYAVVIAERALWIGPYFEKVHGLDGLARGNVALAMSIAMSLGALCYGPAERWSGNPRTLTIVGSLVTGLAYVSLGLWSSASAVWAAGLFCIVGLAGMTYGTLMAHARLFFPPGLIGRGVTFMNFLFIGGAGLAQVASGPFIEYALTAQGRQGRSAATLAFSQLHLAFGISLLAATAIYLLSRRQPPRTIIGGDLASIA